MKNNSVFNLDKLEDVSDFVSKQINTYGLMDATRKVLELFNIKNDLSIDEIIVGLYRLYKIEKTRTWVSYTLYNLSRKKIVEKNLNQHGRWSRNNSI